MTSNNGTQEFTAERTIRSAQTKRQVHSVEEYRNMFLSGISSEQREAFLRALPGSESYRSDGDALQQEVIAHVYGGVPAKSRDALEFIENVFPVTAMTLEGHDIVISGDQIIGPNHAPYVITADTLTFNGGSLTIIATALTINVKKLLVTSTESSSKPYHIGILGQAGRKGSPGSAGRDYDHPASAGSNDTPSSPGCCFGSGGRDGDAGGSGTVGGTGHDGTAGLRNQPASIVVDALDPNSSSLVIFTQSGAGGDGGDGGVGGAGQTGGAGGHGCDAGCEGTHGGDGAAGGAGGTGGVGGKGADGIDGNPITVTFPGASKALLQTPHEEAKPGVGGAGGGGGGGGVGGPGGRGGKHARNGSTGSQGKPGEIGKAGAAGTRAGAPGNFVFHFT